MNRNLTIVAAHWPAMVKAGLITVAMPAADWDKRTHSREAQIKDLARRKKAYAKKKKLKKKKK